MKLEPALKQNNRPAGENAEFLQSQLITYIGNKRALLDFIGQGVGEVQTKIGRDKLSCLDVFAGSGIVSRYLKQYASSITVNDLEQYSGIINRCYLSNKSEINIDELQKLHASLCKKIDRRMAALEKSASGFKSAGFISELYAPASEDNIEKGEHCFYTPYNAAYLDLARQLPTPRVQSKREALRPTFDKANQAIEDYAAFTQKALQSDRFESNRKRILEDAGFTLATVKTKMGQGATSSEAAQELEELEDLE